MSESRSRAGRVAPPVVAAVVALAFLAWPGADRDTVLSNTDALFHFHRVARCLAEFPLVSTLDTYSHFGRPYHVHWLNPFTLLLAAVARVARCRSGDFDGLVATLSWVPPILGAVTAALVALLAGRVARDARVGLLAGVVAALSGDAAIVFHHGMVDHHVATCLGALVAVSGRMRSSLGTWVVGLALMLFFTPEATPMATFLMTSLAGAELIASVRGGEPGPARVWAWQLAPACVAAGALVLHRAMDPHPLPATTWSVFDFSAFHVTWLLGLGVTYSAGSRLVREARDAGMGRALLARVALALTLPALPMALALVGTGQVSQLVDRLGHEHDRISVGEEISILHFGWNGTHWSAWASILVLGFGWTVLRLGIAAWRRAGAGELFLRLVLFLAMALALVELRYGRAFAPLVALALALAAADAVRAVARRPTFSTRAGRVAVAALAMVVLVPPLAWHGIEMRAAIRRRGASAAPVRQLAAWLREATPPAGPRDLRPAYGIFCPWEWGHHVDVLGDRPVVVDAFNHEGVEEISREVWLAGTPRQMEAALRAWGARYLVTVNAGGTLLGLLPRTEVEIARAEPGLPGGVAYFAPLYAFASFRLEAAGGLSGEFGQLQPRWMSPEDYPVTVVDKGRVFSADVPRVKVYELQRGARVVGTAAAGESVDLTCEVVRREPVRAATWVAHVVAAADGRFEIRAPLPAPNAETTFVVPEPCTLTAGTRSTRVTITQDAVTRGDLVESGPWAP